MKLKLVRLLTAVAFSVFVAEAVVVVILKALPPFSTWGQVLLASAVGMALVAPVAYWVVFRPVVRYMSERQAWEEETRRFREQLDEIVRQKTKELSEAVEALEDEVVLQRRSAQELKVSLDFFDAVAQSIRDGLLVIEKDFSISYANEAYCRQVGLPSSQVLGQPCWRISHHAEHICDNPQTECPVSNVFSTGQPTVVVHCHPDREGRERWVEISAAPIRDSSGQVVRVVEVLRDITERWEAERVLEETKAFYERLVGEAGDAIIALDREGRILTWNSGAEQIFGWKREEVLGRSYLELQPEKVDELHEILQRAFSGESFRNLEIRRQRKDGTWFDALTTISPVRDSTGRIIATHGIIKDVTESKRLERELRRAEKLAALGVLSGGAAHEIYNPLNLIALRLQMFLREEGLEPERRQIYEHLMEQVERIRDIVASLSTFAQQMKAERQVLDLHDELHHCLRYIEPEAWQQRVRVVRDFVAESPKVLANSELLHQVFENLLDNAVEAMPQGGTLTIQTRLITRQGEPWVSIAFHDTGQGIPPEDISRVFDPFFTTRDVGEGKGLGLSVALGIVEDHGGTITVESIPGEGSTFTILLPLAKSEGQGP